MDNVIPFCPEGFPGEQAIDDKTAGQTCEDCYNVIVDIGIQNLLSCVMQAAFARAEDFKEQGDRFGYLRHTRAASQITQLLQFLCHDYEEVRRIVAGEEAREENTTQSDPRLNVSSSEEES